MSAVDEHMHLDTHVHVHQGSYPYRGSLMTMDVVREWACGIGHEAGAAMAPCDHPDLGPNSLPSGIYTSGYIHYPTYFLAAEGYRAVEEAVADPDSWVDTYRRYAALLTIAGLVACLVGGRALGFRGAALVAATVAPTATAGILLYGTIANPQAAAIPLGALIAWTGIRWMQSGRGFWWLAAATALASGVAVTHSLPAGVFMLAIIAAPLLRRFGWRVSGDWDPRWWQLVVLTVLVVAPVIMFGWWTRRAPPSPTRSSMRSSPSTPGARGHRGSRGAAWPSQPVVRHRVARRRCGRHLPPAPAQGSGAGPAAVADHRSVRRPCRGGQRVCSRVVADRRRRADAVPAEESRALSRPASSPSAPSSESPSTRSCPGRATPSPWVLRPSDFARFRSASRPC